MRYITPSARTTITSKPKVAYLYGEPLELIVLLRLPLWVPRHRDQVTQLWEVDNIDGRGKVRRDGDTDFLGDLRKKDVESMIVVAHAIQFLVHVSLHHAATLDHTLVEIKLIMGRESGTLIRLRYLIFYALQPRDDQLWGASYHIIDVRAHIHELLHCKVALHLKDKSKALELVSP